MKKTYTLFSVLAVLTLLTACDKTMGTKDSVDAAHAVPAPTLSVAPGTVTYNTITVNLTLDNLDNAYETGVNISAAADMSDAETYLSGKAGDAVVISGLDPETDYYVKGFVFGKGGQAVFTDVKKITTAEAPDLPLAGTYTAKDYQYTSSGWAPGDPYAVTITLEGTTVTIANLWDGGEEIVGEYDEQTHTIELPSYQVLMQHPNYGPAGVYFYNEDLSGYADAGYGSFVPKGGTLEISPYAVRVAAGSFGSFYTEMVHDPVE